jgi:hypothetical protein
MREGLVGNELLPFGSSTAPTKYELVVNMKTARTIRLTISESFLLRAGASIE